MKFSCIYNKPEFRVGKNYIFEELQQSYMDISEEYPQSFDKQHFYGLRSFSQRIQYCTQHLQKIAAGSGRIVFKIDEKTALKLAKNPKGIAQNLQEAQIGTDNYFKSIVAEVYNSDNDDKWIESELAKKVTPTRFKALVGVDINTAGTYLLMREAENVPINRRYRSYDFPPEQLEQLHNNQFLVDIVDLMFNLNIKAGDFTRLSSFGEVIREGQPTIILIDYGLSDEVWQDHYERKPVHYLPNKNHFE